DWSSDVCSSDLPNYEVAKKGHEDYYWGMGLTAEAVANQYKISRQEQDEFSYNSHQKALKAIKETRFKNQIVPINIEQVYVDKAGTQATQQYIFDTDEGPRADTSKEILAKLRPVFAQNGSVTAGNSSQMSGGAAFTLVMSEKMVKELNLEPIARLVSFSAVGVPPRI